VQTAVASLPGVRLVSFTVDPKTDSPAVLAKYAERYQAQPGRWYFLTGAQADLQSLCRNGFKLGDVDGTMVHSTRFVLMDGRGFVRGFYNPTDDDAAMPKLLHDIKTLAAQS
jgi:protein SCO1/2